jgi:hypothetical protein
MPTIPAELLDIDMEDDATVRIALSTDVGTAYARSRLAPHERAALPHVGALWGHSSICPGRVEVLRATFERALVGHSALRPAVRQPPLWRARGVARPCVHGATWQSAPAGRRRATMVGDDVVGSSDGR